MRAIDAAAIDAALSRHAKVALQFSGGRDSIACLFLLQPWWDRLTVYWCNTGDAFPETLAVIEQVKAQVPHFVEIKGDQPGVVAGFGLPSDIVPASRTPIGLMGEQSSAPMIQDRYSCCARVVMLPLHERMLADGVTLVIRGQKAADRLKSPITSGTVDLGIEYLFPIEDWTARDVMNAIRDGGWPLPRFYEVLEGAPDCMTCSAWWEHGVAKYLKRYHHPHYVEVQRRLDIINQAVSGHIAHFNDEVNS
jgi:phosphoadenosine phosphosulfate reductase